jgi:hypothetical protein
LIEQCTEPSIATTNAADTAVPRNWCIAILACHFSRLLLPEFLLFSFQAVEKIYDNVSDPWQIFLQTLDTRFLTESRLEDMPEKFGHITKIRGINIDRSECSTSYIEFVS